MQATNAHGVALRVVSRRSPSAERSASIPSLNIGPGESFPIRIDMQLMRPTQVAGGPLVDVNLDGVLFEDLSCYGPGPAEFLPHAHRLGPGSAARPRALQTHSGAGRP